ncbi:hypothetical protein [Priestia flexa]|uniref:hypothetical protein n=1 Tax=Priestia flexa TaxID=86664 RepID=UPI001B3319B7|nr:hypothetical protein [Priestia flexa]
MTKKDHRHLAHSKEKQTQLLQEEFGPEMGDPNAAKLLEMAEIAKAEKKHKKKPKKKG